MYLYGGVYADLDVICLKPFEALVEAERRADAEGGHDAEPAAVLGMIRHGR